MHRPYSPYKILAVFAFLALGWSLFAATSVNAQDLERRTEEDKVEKRLRFNQHVESILAEQAAREEFVARWSFLGSASAGYDNNVPLTSARQGDFYHEEDAQIAWTAEHSGIPNLFGAGDWGGRFYTVFRDYSDEDDFDYHTMRFTPFFKTSLNDHYLFDVAYTLESLRYIRDNQVNYIGHRGHVRLTEFLNPNFAQRFFFQYRMKDYIDRKAKSATNEELGIDRKDHRYRPGYELLFFPSKSTLAAISGMWIFNESNDLHRDFNDYQGWRINSYIYQKIDKNLTAIVSGGYQFKSYENRTFTGSQSPQRDHYFNVAGYLYMDLTDNTQLVFKYLYYQNYSLDPLQEYSASNVSLGVQLQF